MNSTILTFLLFSNHNLQGLGAHEAGHILKKAIVDKKFNGDISAWNNSEGVALVVRKRLLKNISQGCV